MTRRGKITTQSCELDTSQGKIAYSLKRSSARRTMTISVNSRAQISVLVPDRLADHSIHKFISDKAHWILSKVEEAKKQHAIFAQKRYGHSHEFLFLGRKYPLLLSEEEIKKPTIDFNQENWTVHLPSGIDQTTQEKMIKDKLTAWYREQAQEILGRRMIHYAEIMGLMPKSLFIRSQKRLWGCCDFRKQSINLNWQIILSPVEVVDYVIVHELCHLAVPNHSQRFWQKVEKYLPKYKAQKQWLKDNHAEMMLP